MAVRAFKVPSGAALSRVVRDWRATLDTHQINRATLILVDAWGAEITTETGATLRYTVAGHESEPVITRQTAGLVFEPAPVR